MEDTYIHTDRQTDRHAHAQHKHVIIDSIYIFENELEV